MKYWRKIKNRISDSVNLVESYDNEMGYATEGVNNEKLDAYAEELDNYVNEAETLDCAESSDDDYLVVERQDNIDESSDIEESANWQVNDYETSEDSEINDEMNGEINGEINEHVDDYSFENSEFNEDSDNEMVDDNIPELTNEKGIYHTLKIGEIIELTRVKSIN